MEISLANILLYLNGKLRPLIEEEAVFRAGHIILCGFQKDTEEEKLIGLCLQTSNLKGAPHTIGIKLKTNVNEWQATCSCKAGQNGSCKHIIATLIYANRHEELQEISCTDITQAWGASGSSSADYSAPVTLSEYCHIKVKKRKPDAYVPSQAELSELQNKAFDILTDDNMSDSAIAKLLAGRLPETVANTNTSIDVHIEIDENFYHSGQTIKNYLKTFSFLLEQISEDTKEHETDFYKSVIKINIDQSINIYSQTLSQNNQIWKLARKFRITGTSCYNLYTYAQNVNPDWDKKISNFLNPTFFGNKNTKYGKEMEKIALDFYVELTGKEIKSCGFCINPLVPWLGFSPDGISADGILIEIKCPVLGKDVSAENLLEKLSYIVQFGNLPQLKKKHQYYAQIQLGMCILNLRMCNFIIFSSYDSTCAMLEIPYDYDFCSSLVNRLKEIYFKVILPRITF